MGRKQAYLRLTRLQPATVSIAVRTAWVPLSASLCPRPARLLAAGTAFSIWGCMVPMRRLPIPCPPRLRCAHTHLAQSDEEARRQHRLTAARAVLARRQYPKPVEYLGARSQSAYSSLAREAPALGASAEAHPPPRALAAPWSTAVSSNESSGLTSSHKSFDAGRRPRIGAPVLHRGALGALRSPVPAGRARRRHSVDSNRPDRFPASPLSHPPALVRRGATATASSSRCAPIGSESPHMPGIATGCAVVRHKPGARRGRRRRAAPTTLIKRRPSVHNLVIERAARA